MTVQPRKLRLALVIGVGLLVTGVIYAAMALELWVGTSDHIGLWNGPATLTARTLKTPLGETTGLWHYHPGYVYNVVSEGGFSLEECAVPLCENRLPSTVALHSVYACESVVGSPQLPNRRARQVPYRRQPLPNLVTSELPVIGTWELSMSELCLFRSHDGHQWAISKPRCPFAP